MATYEYADLLIVDTLASLPSSGRRGHYAHVKDTNRLYFWNGSAWVTIGSGGGSAVRPNSLWNPPESPHASDDEFESTTLGWTRAVSGTTCTEGTVGPLASATPDCIQDLHGSWPSWLLLQSDESSAQSVTYTKSYTPTTDATIFSRIMLFLGDAPATNETSILIYLLNSGDANEWALCSLYYTGAGSRSILVQVNNNGALSTSSTAAPATTGLGLFKNGDVYRAFTTDDDGLAFMTPASVTKTGVTTFDQVRIDFRTANNTPSHIMGVDFVRFYDSVTLSLRNP